MGSQLTAPRVRMDMGIMYICHNLSPDMTLHKMMTHGRLILGIKAGEGSHRLTWCNMSHVFVAASHQTRLDTRSKARRPIKVGIKGRGRLGTSRDSNPACLCCSSAHLVQCEPDEASSFTNPNVGPGTYASLRLKLDAWSSAVQRGQKCSSPTRRLPSRSWGPIRPRVCSWFRAPIRHECQTAQR